MEWSREPGSSPGKRGISDPSLEHSGEGEPGPARGGWPAASAFARSPLAPAARAACGRGPPARELRARPASGAHAGDAERPVPGAAGTGEEKEPSGGLTHDLNVL